MSERSPRRGLARASGRWLLGAGLLWVAYFHAGLLWERAVEGTLLTPSVAVRWLAAIGLLLFLARASRGGTTANRRQAGRVFWVLVLLLHATLSPQPLTGPMASAGPETADGQGLQLLLVLPVTATVLLALLSARRRRSRRATGRPPHGSWRRLLRHAQRTALVGYRHGPLVPRAPPA